MNGQVERLTALGACSEAVAFVRANPGLTWPELARKSGQVDWTLWLLGRHSEPGFSFGDTKLERRRNLTRFACWCARRALPKFEAKYPNDRRPALAIESAEQWAAEPTEQNMTAAAAAYAAAYAAYSPAAYAAAAPAYVAAAAAAGAHDAADAADAAYDAAYAAAYAAEVAGAVEKQVQMDELLRLAAIIEGTQRNVKGWS